MIQVRTDIEIDAPVQQIWDVLTDFERYPEWNPFVHQIEGKLNVGEKLKVRLGPFDQKGMAFRPKVVKVETGKTFHWLGQALIPGLMDGEHIFAVEPMSKNKTRFIHGEDYRGLLVTLFGRFVPDDGAPNYVAMNKALKARVESQIQ